jgi:tRNA G18 (ribose-2'-O)-methylase SpoU
MSGRGFFGVGIYHPKREVNVGGVWRAAHLFGASFAFTVGARYNPQSADTSCFRRHAPLFHYEDMDDLRRHLPHGAPLVGVELDDRAVMLGTYDHRPSAVYLLGAEDHGLPPDVLTACHDVVQIEAVGAWSMNVAAAASVLLHDRLMRIGAPS